MIAISKYVASSSSNTVVIRNHTASNLSSRTARVSRIATLDGGVYIEHNGAADGDRTLSVQAGIDITQANLLHSIFETQTQVFVSTMHGCFVGAIQSISTDNGDLRMNVLISSRKDQ